MSATAHSVQHVQSSDVGTSALTKGEEFWYMDSHNLSHLRLPSAVELCPSFVDDLWPKISAEPTSGCWLWLGGLTAQGYAQVKFIGRLTVAHRITYQFIIGRIPEGMTLDHLCRTRSCINPLHLEPVTRGENVRRGDAGLARGLQLRSRTHCPQGHEYSGRNLMVRAHRDGTVHRHCRECSLSRARVYKAKIRALAAKVAA